MLDAWNRRLELLKVYDEIQQCKQRIDLPQYELEATYQESLNGAIQAEMDLNDAISNLNFFKKQEEEARQLLAQRNSIQSKSSLQRRKQRIETFPEEEESTRLSKYMEDVTANEADSRKVDRSLMDDLLSENMTETHTSSSSDNIPTKSSSHQMLVSKKPTQEASIHQEDDYLCIICREDMRMITNGNVVLLPCCHVLHEECIHLWMKGRKSCPICKRAIKKSELIPISNFGEHLNDNTIQLMNTNQLNPLASSISHEPISKESIASADINSTWTNRHPSLDRNIQMISSDSISQPAAKVSRIVRSVVTDKPYRSIKGQWGTKIDAVVGDIIEMLSNPDSRQDKAIVFSQWIEVRLVGLISFGMIIGMIIR